MGASSSPSPSGPRRILVVDDQRDTVDLITLALLHHGWQVEAAARADEALDRLRERPFDLVISHLNLPDQVATAMLREAREAGSLATTSVLIITGQATVENPEDYPILRKPLDIDALVRQVTSILEGGAPEAGAEESAVVDLVLYYTPPWPSSMKARRNLEKILKSYESDAVHLTMRDLGEHPDLAEKDGVVFSPTLIKRSPGAPVWMLGDLSDSNAVTDLLLAAGLKPRP